MEHKTFVARLACKQLGKTLSSNRCLFAAVAVYAKKCLWNTPQPACNPTKTLTQKSKCLLSTLEDDE
jgi:hypothetical protein